MLLILILKVNTQHLEKSFQRSVCVHIVKLHIPHFLSKPHWKVPCKMSLVKQHLIHCYGKYDSTQ